MSDARDLFEQASRAVRRLSVVDAELAAIDEGWRSGDWLQPTKGGRHSDSTATRALYRMGRSGTLDDERRELAETIGEASRLADGVGELLGPSYALALRYRYLDGMFWNDVAERLLVSVSTARNRVDAALDTIDALGRAHVLEARGIAVG